MQQLVEPAYRSAPDYVQTLGPEVADLCELANFPPDPEQRLALDLIFAIDRHGRSVAFEAAVIVARQNMKTGVFKQAALGWLFVTEQRLIVWSAHEFDTTQEAFRDLAGLIEGCPYLSRRLKKNGIKRGNGDESIELATGQRIKFKARTKTGGRGLTGDKVVLDEAFALRPDHMGSLMPTLSVRPDPQLVYGSSAGLSNSEVLRKIRDRGRRGDASRLAYLEWCASQEPCADPRCTHEFGEVEGCVLDDRERWQAGNPLLGRTRPNGTGLTYDYVQAEREALPPSEFARERLGWWDDPAAGEPVFGEGRWEACSTGQPRPPAPAGLALAVSYELTHASISAAGLIGDDEVFVKPLQHGPGTGWAITRAKALQQTYGLDVVIDGRGPGAMLIEPLQNAGVRLRIADTGEVLDSCAQIFEQVRERKLHHESYPELDDAVRAAVKRPVGDRWAWGRRKATADISALESVTLAAWAASITPRSAYEDSDLIIA